jgi:hypothetical protein
VSKEGRKLFQFRNPEQLITIMKNFKGAGNFVFNI